LEAAAWAERAAAAALAAEALRAAEAALEAALEAPRAADFALAAALEALRATARFIVRAADRDLERVAIIYYLNKIIYIS
jgi:hypothetical protein